MATRRMANSTIKLFDKILSYAKDRTETLGGIVEHYKNKERIEGYLTTPDRLVYGKALSQMEEIDKFIFFLERMFPQGNNVHITNNEEEEKLNVI